MATPLPARPSLAWLRKRAKLLLQQLRQSNPNARLAEAQRAVARDAGFPSWRALKAQVDRMAAAPPRAYAPPDEATVAAFLRLVRDGRTDAVALALAMAPVLVNARGPHPSWGGRPQPLHLAVESGRREMVRLLLDAGADVNGSNDQYDHWSPLLLAIQKGDKRLQRMLRRRGARVGLAEALALGDDEALASLLASGESALAGPVPNDGSWLAFARTTEAIDRLLDLGVSPDTQNHWGATPVQELSGLGRKGAALVRHLEARRGVHVDPVAYARMGDRAALARVATRDPDALRDARVLVAAVDFRHRLLASWLLRRGADPNARAGGDADQTPLHCAAWNGDLPMVQLLLAAGADPSLHDHQYDATPLGWAETAIEVTGNKACRAVADYLRALGTRGDASALA